MIITENGLINYPILTIKKLLKSIVPNIILEIRRQWVKTQLEEWHGITDLYVSSERPENADQSDWNYVNFTTTGKAFTTCQFYSV